MRLINVDTMKMEMFHNPPKNYAILSHTWAEEEVTLPDFIRSDFHAYRMKGSNKIHYACQQAKAKNIPYAWVDTCCIDKSSSAELSEAINSMFKWYQGAAICYVYLEDVDQITSSAEAFRKSRWFTRGWTLQELIAPGSIEFYGRHWSYLGTKNDLVQHIVSASGVFETVLLAPWSLYHVSVAARMSWACQRNTARGEDRAYSLLGIFDVHMPLIYGEGAENAFIRLQQEIAKTSDDESLFAWRSSSIIRKTLLAPDPEGFKGMADVIVSKFDLEVAGEDTSFRSFSLSNRGLEIQGPLIEVLNENLVLAALQCCKISAPNLCFAIHSRLKSTRNRGNSQLPLNTEICAGVAFIDRRAVNSAEFGTIHISDSSHIDMQAMHSYYLHFSRVFNVCPLLNKSFSTWNSVDPSYVLLEGRVAFTAVEHLLPSQTKATIQFTAAAISEPHVTFFCCSERDIVAGNTFIHAVPKRSESWPQNYEHGSGHVCPCGPDSLQISANKHSALGMCWQIREDCIFLAVVGLYYSTIFVAGVWIPLSSHFFDRLQEFVAGPAFYIKDVLKELKWEQYGEMPLSTIRQLDSRLMD